MTSPFVVALAGQYNKALKMMEDAVRDCPDVMWEADLWPDEAPTSALPQGGLGGSAPWLLAHHFLTIADYDLTGGFQAWEPPPPFDEHQGGEALRVFSQSEVLESIGVLRDRVRATLTGSPTREPLAPCLKAPTAAGLSTHSGSGALPSTSSNTLPRSDSS